MKILFISTLVMLALAGCKERQDSANNELAEIKQNDSVPSQRGAAASVPDISCKQGLIVPSQLPAVSSLNVSFSRKGNQITGVTGYGKSMKKDRREYEFILDNVQFGRIILREDEFWGDAYVAQVSQGLINFSPKEINHELETIVFVVADGRLSMDVRASSSFRSFDAYSCEFSPDARNLLRKNATR
ncbi:MAG: hypothetical protein NTV34_01470 [Proteobacteria bacterium]|nr:hypothetical protein [Pseudomonadota bacterium]